MNTVSQGPISLGRKDGGYGIGQPAARRLSYFPRNALHGAVFLGHTPCSADQRSGQSCRQCHAPRTMLGSTPVQACPRSSSIRDMDRSC
jgi:hypothetical protein